jgi:predicted oxidoreductase
MSTQLPSISLGALRVSRIGLGMMGLSGTWDPTQVTDANIERAVTAVKAAVDLGINLFDHADIYGRTTCETVFKECLAALPNGREGLIIATKCGIRITNDPPGSPYHYNLSEGYIRRSVESSLERMGIEYIDLLQVHRPDPSTHPRETARALDNLVEEGLVRSVGVSNYFPEQVRALERYLIAPIVSTQPAISLWDLSTLDNGILDQAEALAMRPLAYSPLGGGILAGRELEADHPRYPVWQKLMAMLAEVAAEVKATPKQVALAWLLQHPSGVVPLVGSTNPVHIAEAVGALKVQLTREQWYRLWAAARPVPLP